MSDEVYVLGEDEGFLAVFYEDGKKQLRLKERTELPLSALPDGEARQLQEGCASSGGKSGEGACGFYVIKNFGKKILFLIRKFYCKKKTINLSYFQSGFPFWTRIAPHAILDL